MPAVVTRENIKAEIFDKGINTAEEICTGRYAEGCAELGITVSRRPAPPGPRRAAPCLDQTGRIAPACPNHRKPRRRTAS